MNCSYCSIKIGEKFMCKEPFFLKIRGKNRILCSDCYDYLKELGMRERGIKFIKHGAYTTENGAYLRRRRN